MKDEFLQDFCDQVFNMDPHVRFVGIASREGKILGFRYRPGSMILKYYCIPRGFV